MMYQYITIIVILT